MAVNCICCEREMENVMPGCFQPIDGVAFWTYGHYGSTYFDPMNGSTLEIAVCDECLEAAEKRGHVLRNETGVSEAVGVVI